MYEQFFGLDSRPFELTPNPRYLLLTKRHREALSNLEYGIAGRRSLTVLTGEAGTGKTTLLRRALGKCASLNPERPGVFLLITNPTLTRGEFIESLASALQLSANAAISKARFLVELERTLLELRRTDTPVALVVDEAQSLPAELLEEIRLLANVETDTEKLLPLVLVGQPELSDRLNEPGLRQLKQRIALRCTLAPLDLGETASYIATRISIGGGTAANVFTREAVRAVYQRSRGIPRLINVLCDNALISAFAIGQKPVGEDIVAEVGADFDLHPETSAGPGVVRVMGNGTTRPVRTADAPAPPAAPPAEDEEAVGARRSVLGLSLVSSTRRWPSFLR
jgi:general secretion pathway protein A